MKFVLNLHIKPPEGSRDVHSYVYRSTNDLYTIVRNHSPTRPGYCGVIIGWKIKRGQYHDGMYINPRFRIADHKEVTGIFLVNELLGLLRFVPENIRVQDLRSIVRAFAGYYGTLIGHGRKLRCEITSGLLAKKMLFVKPMMVRRIFREAGLTYGKDDSSGREQKR